MLAPWWSVQPKLAPLPPAARQAAATAIFSPTPSYEGKYIELQQRIVAAYGGPNGVVNAIRAGYFIPLHLGAVVTGAGFALANWRDALAFGHAGHSAGAIDLNSPFFLLYAPTGRPGHLPDGREGTFDDIWPDPPYELIGWLYGTVYDPAKRPHLDGIPDEAWFVHEAGWHMSDGRQILMPPRENCLGEVTQDPPIPPGPTYVNDEGDTVFAIVGHGRAWDIHFWRNPNIKQPPLIAMNEPFDRLPRGTLDLPYGAFFSPAVGTRCF